MEFGVNAVNSHKAHIRSIKKANEENRLAIFIGSGVSKSSDSDSISLPTWEDLINDLKEDLSITDETDYLKLAQLYYLEFDEPSYYQKIKSYFPENIEPSKLHDLILELRPRVIITTNWDNILEKTIEKGGYTYDVVCSDKDLVKSTIQNKLIKMHGDFKNHNIVFKEDDYLNYPRSFPLIENYIKSTLSTHTILFLGYSYSDINLKHIMKWIQSHSSSTPPMYFINSKENKTQQIYLKNHRITTLTLDEETYKTEVKNGLDKKSGLIFSFLKKIQKQEDFEVNINVDDEDIIDYIYRQISHLEHLRSVSLEQIRSAFTNCGFLHTEKGLSILEFYESQGVLTSDYNDDQRIIHAVFVKIIKQFEGMDSNAKEDFRNKHPELNKVFTILDKARITGIVTEKDRGGSRYFENYLSPAIEDRIEADRMLMSFNYSVNENLEGDVARISQESYVSYKNGDYENAFKLNAKLVSICKKQRIYSMLLVALFNRNMLLFSLKFSFDNQNENNKIIEGEIEADLQTEFFQFPRDEVKKNQFLYDFLSMNSVHRLSSYCTKKILDIKDSVSTVVAGGMSFNSNADEPKSKHINTLMFTIINNIMIDYDSTYKSSMRDFVRISILRQSINEDIYLNNYEIYSAIQYFKQKELENELRVFAKNGDKAKHKITINAEDVTWLAFNIFPNLIALSIRTKSGFNQHGDQLRNTILMLSYIELNEDQTANIMSGFSELISSRSISISDYEAVNAFLVIQYNNFQNNIETDILISILDKLINKIVSKTANAWDHHAITMNRINNIYGYIQVNKGVYSNKNQIKKLLLEIGEYSIEEQKKYARSLLYSIFNISNNLVKKQIQKFIQGLIGKNTNEKFEEYEFDLWSTAVGFKDFNPELINKIKEFIEQYKDGNAFSSQLYSLKSLTDHLVKSLNIDQLKDIDSDLQGIIERYRDRPNHSYL